MSDKTKFLMEDEKFKNTLSELHTFYLEKVLSIKNYQIIHFINLMMELKNSGIKEKITYLSEKVREVGYPLTTPFSQSLQKNIRDYIKKDPNDYIYTWVDKWVSIVYSFQSFLGSLEVVDSFIRYQSCTSADKKSILALSTVEDEKEIRANEEIQKLTTIYNEDDSVFIYPVYGCTFNVFKTLIKNWDFDIIHICGHGETEKYEKKLKFVNESIGYVAFVNAFKNVEKKKELTFLNCCLTYEFVKGKSLPFSNYTLCYDGYLHKDFGISIALSFYRFYQADRVIPSVWQKVVEDSMEQDINYYYLLD